MPLDEHNAAILLSLAGRLPMQAGGHQYRAK